MINLLANFNEYYNETLDIYQSMPYGIVLMAFELWENEAGIGVSRDNPKDALKMAARYGIGIVRTPYTNYWIRPANNKRTRFDIRPDNRIPSLPY